MAYRELVKEWHKAVLALEKGDWESALSIFCSIENPPSKIDFNIGCLCLLGADLEQALEALDRAVAKDNCLAVGFFQRSYVHLRLERYEEALIDCRLALRHLRNNAFIDYKQLGLKFVLCTSEVLYNSAAASCRLGKWQDAQKTLEEALRQSPERQSLPHVGAAVEQVQEHLFLEPRSVPQGEFFRPRKKDVEELESKDFLGQPTVISSAFEEDHSGGFQGLQPQGCFNPEVDPSRALASGYHCLVAPYYPEKASALSAGSIIRVSSTGPDKCVTGIYEGQRISVPVSYLTPLGPSRPGKGNISSVIPLPPGKVPPNRPHQRQSRAQQPGGSGRNVELNGGSGPKADLQVPPDRRDAPLSNGQAQLLTVHGSYTVNLQVSQVPSLADLHALVQEKYWQQVEQMTLRFQKSPGSEASIPIRSDEELRSIWPEVPSSPLTLWCQGKEDGDESAARPVLYRMVARHSYAGRGQADLNFKDGDKLEILSEVNEEWLEGRCNGIVGIFPKCFAVREGAVAAQS